jgi:arabinofuranosyltransferase
MWVLVLIGLGPTIRPDLAIFSVGFAVFVVVCQAATWRRRVGAVAVMAVVPGAVEVFRVVYYGLLVPNTALAKEAFRSNWVQGWRYLVDFVGPHQLLIPLVGLVAVAVTLVRAPGNDRARRYRTLSVATVGAGVAHVTYITKLGGGYMHGRLLLASMFSLMLPVASVAVESWTWLVAAGVATWSVMSIAVLEPGYSRTVAGHTDKYDAIDTRTGIGDERLWYLRFSGRSHPVTAADYAATPWVHIGRAMAQRAASGQPALVGDGPIIGVPRADLGAPVAYFAGSIGMFAYTAGSQVFVMDSFGLVNTLAAHGALTTRGRPGHERSTPMAWFVALYGDPSTPAPAGTSPAELAAARRALSCGTLHDLVTSVAAPLGWHEMWHHVWHAWEFTTFRFPVDPVAAAATLCHTAT